MQIPFIGGSYQHSAKGVGNARSVNWFPEMITEGSTQAMMKGAPGIASFVDTSKNIINGMHFFDGHIWAVADDTLIRIDKNGTQTTVGTLEENQRASMGSNSVEVIISNGINGYYIDLAGPTLNRITDVDFYPSSVMTVVDGYAVFVRDGTEQVFNSDNDDASTYGALDFLQVSKVSGYTRAVETDGEYLWVFKENSGQVYYNAANVSGSPFSIQDGASFNIGVMGKYGTAADSEGSVYFYGSNGRVYMTSGLGFQPISHEGIEDEIGSFTTKSDAIGMTYVDRGQIVFVLNFPTEGRCFEYRKRTGVWSERESWGLGYWRANCIVRAWDGEYYVGDSESGKIGKLSSTTYLEWTDPLEAYRICQHFEADGAPFWINDLEFVFEPGVGNTNDPASDPECILRFSDDDGRTWWGFRTAKLGKKGEYRNRAIIRDIGSAERRTFRLSVKDPIQRDLIKVVGGGIEVGAY